MKEAYNFVDFASAFHLTNRFTCENVTSQQSQKSTSGLKAN